MNPSKIPHEIIEKWLQCKIENGQSIIELLINMKESERSFDPSDFKKIDTSVTDDRNRIIEALNEYFIKNHYPFEADFDYNYNEAYIKRTRPLVCYFHNFLKLKTESDLNEHRECLTNPPPFHLRTERIEYPDPILPDEDRATTENQEKKIEEERKAFRDR